MRHALFVAAAALLLTSGCSDDKKAGTDAGMDAAVDANAPGSGAGGASGSGGAPGSGGSPSGTNDGGGGTGDASADDDAGSDMDAMVTLPPASDCGRIGDGCTSVDDCCSGLCDPTSNTCISSLQVCADDGERCASPTDCCSLSCGADGRCGANACISDGESCGDDTECCGRSCQGGTCEPLNDACRTAGNACTASDQCCSGLCKDDKCQLAASFCIQEGDLCGRAEDCCTGRCDMVDGRDVGVCGPPPSGASFCNDGVEGSICDSCNDCCSRLCAPYGPTGVDVCQPASGCHVTGDFCREDRDCCGAPDTGLPGEGHVRCEKEDGSDLGICRNPMSCSPQGNVCHFKDYACGVSSARANCCGGLGAKGGVCQLDGLGVPRCNGLGDECIAAGEICASADDCCGDVPCVPDDEGVLRCFDPPGDDACVPAAGPCTVNADCCPGGTCIRPVGSTQGTCTPTEPPPDTDGGTPSGKDGGTTPPGKDGGTTPPPSCSEYGQICDSASDCCNDVPCTDGICRVPFG